MFLSPCFLSKKLFSKPVFTYIFVPHKHWYKRNYSLISNQKKAQKKSTVLYCRQTICRNLQKIDKWYESLLTLLTSICYLKLNMLFFHNITKSLYNSCEVKLRRKISHVNFGMNILYVCYFVFNALSACARCALVQYVTAWSAKKEVVHITLLHQPHWMLVIRQRTYSHS